MYDIVNIYMYNHMSMLILMFVSGIFSSMSVWADKWSDVRISINDVYMALLMCAWMLVFMGVQHRDLHMIFYGVVGVVTIVWAIRVQFLVGPRQYITSMIPHHSMAITMSKRLLQRPHKSSPLYKLAKEIVTTQEKEIQLMKSL